MKSLVRGGYILALLSVCVVFIYAQRKTDDAAVIAKNSLEKFENNIAENTFINVNFDDDKKLVKTTSLVTARGASKGAFSASAYCFSGRTAIGQGVRRGVIAADPRVLRMGSKVYLNAGSYSGIYTVADTGGAIRGKKIDIWVPGCAEARRFGRRSVEIFALP